MKQFLSLKKVKTFLLLTVLSFTFLNASAYDLVVAKDGSGNYTTVQAALNAAPSASAVPFTIFIKNGKYREKITVSKPFIQLIGESVANVFIYYDDPATILGTQGSASFSINAADFSAFNITFANTYGDGSQAVAVLVNADRASFKNCRFLGNQDTLYLKGTGTPRDYFKNCYIDGNIDFIFGSAIAVFDSCIVYAKSRTSAGSSFITAPNTPTGQNYGFVFRDTKLPNNTGATSYYLSRPWPSPSEAATRQKTVYLSCLLSSHIQTAGWTTWDANTITANVYYGEYNSKYFNGATVDVSQRVPWSYQLTQTDSSTYTFANMFGTWDPCSVYPGFCSPSSSDIAVSNFRGAKGASASTFNWNISWAKTGIRYQLFRSTDNISFSQIDDITAANDTSINFQSTDVLPPAGSIYYYYLSASKAGAATHITDTIQISSKPTITTTSALGSFSQGLGTPSASQGYTVSAVNLIDNLTITPPVNYEVSANGGSTWFTNASPLVIAPLANTVANTTILVRLNAGALGTYSGNIVHTSSGADPVSIAVTGTTSAAAPIPSVILQQWPFTQNNLDSAAIRSAAVTASTPSFNNFNISDGLVSATTGVAIPPYSTNFGQAFAPTAAGLWTTASGGPGGTLNRRFYEQFTITAAAGNTVKLDSIILNVVFVSTVSNVRMAMVYSKNGFSSPADSLEFSGGSGGQPYGPIAFNTTGNFTNGFLLAQQNSGPITPLDYNYRLALAGSSGVTLSAGQTLTLRIYFSCGSGSNGKYVTIRNFISKGSVLTILPLHLLSFNAGYDNDKVRTTWSSSNETDIKKYVVQRSIDAGNFNDVGSSDPKNIAAQSDYLLNDQNPLQGVSYYRLKIINLNSSVSYSNIVSVNSKPKSLILIYPNPVIDNIIVNHPKANAGAVISISTMDGRIVSSQSVLPGSVSGTLNVRSLSGGNYLLIYQNNTDKLVTKFVKQ